MKTTKVAALVVGIAVLLFVAMPSLSWAAEDGKALYGAKCAACHKADGAGNPAMKAPAINTPEMAAKVPAAITDAKNAKHASVKALNADQVKAVAEYVKTLKK
jgi:mono/diheme cytochrome c family protein